MSDYRPTLDDHNQAKVVNISDRRNAQRIVNLVNQAMLNADIELNAAERTKLWRALIDGYIGSGYVLTRQVSR